MRRAACVSETDGNDEVQLLRQGRTKLRQMRRGALRLRCMPRQAGHRINNALLCRCRRARPYSHAYGHDERSVYTYARAGASHNGGRGAHDGIQERGRGHRPDRVPCGNEEARRAMPWRLMRILGLLRRGCKRRHVHEHYNRHNAA